MKTVSFKVISLNLKFLNQAKNSHSSSEFPNQNLRQMGERVHEPCLIHTKKQTDITTLYE